MEFPLMECGHTAQGVDQDGKPVCVVCILIHPGATKVAQVKPDLTGRKARCTYYGWKCNHEQPSSTNLAFFEHRPDKEYDLYYCGCYGWD